MPNLYLKEEGIIPTGTFKALGDFLVLDAINKTDGCAIAVSDDELRKASALLARTEGTFICPEGLPT